MAHTCHCVCVSYSADWFMDMPSLPTRASSWDPPVDLDVGHQVHLVHAQSPAPPQPLPLSNLHALSPRSCRTGSHPGPQPTAPPFPSGFDPPSEPGGRPVQSRCSIPNETVWKPRRRPCCTKRASFTRAHASRRSVTRLWKMSAALRRSLLPAARAAWRDGAKRAMSSGASHEEEIGAWKPPHEDAKVASFEGTAHACVESLVEAVD